MKECMGISKQLIWYDKLIFFQHIYPAQHITNTITINTTARNRDYLQITVYYCGKEQQGSSNLEIIAVHAPFVVPVGLMQQGFFHKVFLVRS